MIIAAITNLKERMGSSRYAIKKYIHQNYGVDDTKVVDSQINIAIKRGVEAGLFAQPKGPSGTVKLVKKERPVKKESAAATKKQEKRKARKETKQPSAIKAADKKRSKKSNQKQKTAALKDTK
ncbi:uncharacterized protein VTP21DRAFT_6311 [Calcarisporiella thermophila]|uniref:uncharacterized protein n=1 Tax=Calcarisporiella thermophila TaxID=911321 RepID=UPI0037430E6E